MNDLAVYQEPPTTGQILPRNLREWAEEASAAHSLATALSKTAFVPESYRGKPDDAAAAILTGAEMGFSPMASLQAFDVIQGRAAARAIALRAVVQQHGHQIIVEESTENRCKVKGLRKGDSEWQTSTWTIQRAQKMKLTGKDNWSKQPQAMLLARATAEICRMIAADAIMGVPYAIEEIDDGPTTKTRTRTVTQPAPRQPETIEATVETGPPLPTEPEPEPETGELITDAQQRKLRAQLADLGYGSADDRDTVLRAATQITGRIIATSKELTKPEAMKLIDALENDGAVLLGQATEQETTK